jgi:hypothetical protein
MTLALACITPEFVTLVADRRVTFGSEVLEDVATKVVVVCDRGAIAYSGIARFPVPGRRLDDWPRMDEWIVSTLAKYKVAALSEAAKVLRAEATTAFKRLSASPEQLRLAFMIVGWSVSSDDRRTPTICLVSNALDDNWEWLPAAESEFQQRAFFQDNLKKFSLASIGVPVPKPVLNDVRRTLRKGFPRGIGPQSVFRLCVLAIRRVAAINSLVGEHLLGVCVPPCSLEPGPRLLVAGGPSPSTVTFMDFKVSQEFGSLMGPHFVCGGSGLTGAKVGVLNP